MGRRSDRALASLLLTNRFTEGEVAPLTPKEFWSLVRVVEDPARLLQLDVDGVMQASGVSEDRARQIHGLMGSATQLAFELERLEQEGYQVLSPFDDAYPRPLLDRLGDAAPPTLVCAGPPQLLGRDGIGIVGSRNASPDAIEVARRAAEKAVGSGAVVVSGGARGIDQQAMASAYQAGGEVVGILAEGLIRRVRDPETRKVIGEGRVCLLTPYKPDAGFSVANAMNRNRLIYALSRITLVVATDEGSGGTWGGAVEALRRRYGQVAVWMGPGGGPGNGALARLGAHAIDDLDDLPGLGRTPEARATAGPTQERLGF